MATVTAPADYGQRITVWKQGQHEREARVKVDEFVLEPGESKDLPDDPSLGYETADLPVLNAPTLLDANGEPRFNTREQELKDLTLDKVREASALHPGNVEPTPAQREKREQLRPQTSPAMAKRTDAEVGTGKSGLPETTLHQAVKDQKAPVEPTKKQYSDMNPEAQARAERPIPEAEGIKAMREGKPAPAATKQAAPAAKPAPAAPAPAPAKK